MRRKKKRWVCRFLVRTSAERATRERRQRAKKRRTRRAKARARLFLRRRNTLLRFGVGTERRRLVAPAASGALCVCLAWR